MSDPAGRAARAAYRETSVGTRVHVGVRWRTCPFSSIAAALSGAHTILDVGCGHGLFPLYLAARDPAVRVTGVDIDDAKLEIAAAAAARAGVADRVTFRPVAPGWTPASGIPGAPATGWDAITIVDVLYLLGHAAAERLIADAAAALAPAGRVVVKELDTTPAWKWRASLAQEVLATKVLRITAGEQLEHMGIATLEPALRAAGLDPTTTRLDRGRIHPDYLSVGSSG